MWKITSEDEAALDRYEGFPWFYEKEEFEVWLGGGRIRVMAYVMAPGHIYGAPDGHYLHIICEGYGTVGFDQAVLDEAVRYSTELYQHSYTLTENGYIKMG